MPAWIHPLRLTTVSDAHDRVTAICSHLRGCLLGSSDLLSVVIPPHLGVEDGCHDRSEIENCANHAELIAFALGWAVSNDDTREAIVTECHCAQSSGGADLVLFRDETVWLFEAGAGVGSNVKKKHKDDVRELRQNEELLMNGAVVRTVHKYRVVRTEMLRELPQIARTSVVARTDASCLLEC